MHCCEGNWLIAQSFQNTPWYLFYLVNHQKEENFLSPKKEPLPEITRFTKNVRQFKKEKEKKMSFG